MEEPRLLDSALRHWWVVVLAFSVTTALTILWVGPKPADYESSGTYVVRPRSSQNEDSVRALETLVRGTQINATYALIARSDAIKKAAVARLPVDHDNAHLRVEAEAVPGTNALTISARARNAEAAHALATSAGEETIDYVGALNQPYTLALLDAPKAPSHSVNSRKPLTIVLGALLGLMLGLGLAVLLDRVAMFNRKRQRGAGAIDARELEVASHESIPAVAAARVQPAVTGAPVASALAAGQDVASLDLVANVSEDPCVQQEMMRADDGCATYSLGVLKLEAADAPTERSNGASTNNGSDHGSNDGNSGGSEGEDGATASNNGHGHDDRRIEALLRDHVLANGRTLTHVRDGVFAAVLPDINAVATSQLLSDWLADVSERDDDPSTGLLVSMTVVEYAGHPNAATPDTTAEG